MNNDKIIYVPTNKIKYITEQTFFDIEKEPVVDGGNWDVEDLIDIEKDFMVYKSIDQIINKGANWENTELYDYIVENMNYGSIKWACDTLEKCKNRGQYLLNLYDDVKLTGRIMPSEELRKVKGIKGRNCYRDNDCIQVAIGRYGQVLFAQNGSHRFCMAKILGFKFVPAKVCRRHIEWENYRKTVFDLCAKNWNGKAYQTLPHPDFDEIESIHEDNRYDLVFENTDLRNVKLLDIGSLFGYICYRAESDGFNCTAVEPSTSFSTVLKKLHYAMDMKYRIFKDSIFYLDDKQHDIVIAFNIFHHFLKNEVMYNNLVKLLNELEYKEMFIQLHTHGENQMKGAYRDYTEDEFCKFIIENSKNKTTYRVIGEENGRKICKIY